MDKNTYITVLYDYYGELLSSKQKEYFEDYYFNNLSLSEISDNLGISRNAVHKSLKAIEKKLEYYESKLHLYQKNINLKQIINTIKDQKLASKLEKLI